MSVGEEVAPLRHPVVAHPKAEGPLEKLNIGLPFGLIAARRRFVLRRRTEIDSPTVTVGHDRHQPRPHPSSFALGLDVVSGNWRSRHDTLKVRAAPELSAVLCRLAILWLAQLHREAVAGLLDHGLDVCLAICSIRQPESGDERHIDLREGRVWALYRARPKPGNHGEFSAHKRFQILPLTRHLSGDLDLRVEMPDALLGLVAHPLSVVAHVIG